MNVKKSIIVVLYVNDILIIDLSKIGIQRIKKALNDKFHMFDLRPCVYYLDMIVKRDRVVDILRLRQAGYVTRFLKHFNYWSLNSVSTSLKTSRKLQFTKESYITPRKLCENYQSIMRSLIYVILKTRSDIVYAVSLVSRYSVNSTQTHWNTVIRIFRYLRGTIYYELVYKESLQALIGYTDSDWADDSTRRSTFDYLFNVDSGAIN